MANNRGKKTREIQRQIRGQRDQQNRSRKRDRGLRGGQTREAWKKREKGGGEGGWEDRQVHEIVLLPPGRGGIADQTPEQKRQSIEKDLRIKIGGFAAEPGHEMNRGQSSGGEGRRTAGTGGGHNSEAWSTIGLSPDQISSLREVLSGRRQPSLERVQATPGERKQPLSKRTQSEDWLVILKERNDRRI